MQGKSAVIVALDVICFKTTAAYTFCGFLQIYPHRFPGTAGTNPAQVATCTI